MKNQYMLNLFKKSALPSLFIILSFSQIFSQENHNIFPLKKSYLDGNLLYQHEINSLNPFLNPIINGKSLIKNSNSEPLLIDSIITFSVNGTLSYKCTYNYDLNRRVSFLKIDYWYFNQWEKDWQFTFTYNSAGNLITVLHQSWNGNNWNDWGRETFIYDSNRNKLFGLFERWDNGMWV
jgi:hypothetical protein